MLEEDAINVLKFMASNGLVANPKKTTLLFLNLKSKMDPISINIGNEKIVQESSAKLLGIVLEDNKNWKANILGCGGVIPSLNKRLFQLRRLRNHLNDDCLLKVANSIYTSKLRYGLQLCAKVRWLDSDTTDGMMKDLQKTQNKLLRFLNKSKIKDKINTKVLLQNMNMLSVNQMNAQIKLTETWKALNNKNSALKNLKQKTLIGSADRISRSITNGDLIEEGTSEMARSSFLNDSTRLWNGAPLAIKSCKSLLLAKKEIKKFVLTLPI